MKNFGIVLSILVFLFSCQNSAEENVKKLKAQKQKELLEKINQLEKEVLSNSASFDILKANQLVDVYDEYTKSFASDSLTGDYLFKAGDVSISANRYFDAIQFFEKLYKYHPSHAKHADALFMMGFVYDEHIKNKGKASEIYDQFIKKYPEHTLINDVISLKENLTLSDEELIKKFEEMNKAKTVAP